MTLSEEAKYILESGIIQTPCGGKRCRKECAPEGPSDMKYCSDWDAPVRKDGYYSACYFMEKTRKLLNKIAKMKI